MTLSLLAARRVLVAAIAVAEFLAPGLPSAWADGESDKPEAPIDAQLPAAPQPISLIPLYVAPNSINRFFVDADSLSVGAAGLIRYTVVIKSPSGATTVNFEGIQCPQWLHVAYAFGQDDGTWAKARNPNWGPIGGSGPNGYQYTLYRYYLCPDGVPVHDAAEAVAALRRDVHSTNRLLPRSVR